MLRLLFLGDIVGEPGRKAVIDIVPRWKEERAIDFVIVNGENSANGRGITPKICTDLLRAKVAVITTGDHVWDQKEIVAHLDMEPRLLRPINYPPATPGRGSIVLDTPKGKVAVINVQGRTFMHDPLAVAVAFGSGLVTVQPLHLKFEVIDQTLRTMPYPDLEPNVRVAVDVQAQEFVEFWLERLEHLSKAALPA